MIVKTARHGTDVGYSIDGCREDCCARAHMRAQKERALYRSRHGSCRVSRGDLRTVLEPWLRMGVTLHAVAEAAGKCGDHLLDADSVQRDTFEAFAKLTEDDLLDTSLVPADLTRHRIYSLMAGGHRLDAMPITAKSGWRSAAHVEIGTARAIRAYYAANEAKIGPSPYTATRARGRGHLPPMAWDDPGTLAWPNGAPVVQAVGYQPRKHDIDPVVVERILGGDRLPATQAEKREVTRRWVAAGRSLAELERRTGWNSGRYTEREAS